MSQVQIASTRGWAGGLKLMSIALFLVERIDKNTLIISRSAVYKLMGGSKVLEKT